MIFNIQKLAVFAAVIFTSVSALSIPGNDFVQPQAREASPVDAREEVRSFEPSRVVEARGAQYPQPSGSSSDKKCIKITKKVYGTTLTVGYLSESYIHGTGIFKITWNKWDCLKVVVPSGPGPFDLPIHGENGPRKYLGLAGNDNLKASYAVKTAKTTVNSPPQNVGNSASPSLPLSESAVWSVNGGVLSAIWWPQSGGKTDVKTMLWPQQLDYLYFVTKPTQFTQSAPSAYEVTLRLVNP